MNAYTDIADRDVERLLAGQTPVGDARFGDVARFVADLQDAYPTVSTDAREASHVAAMMEAAGLVAEHGEPATQPPSPLPRTVLRPWWAKAAAIAAAGVLAFGGTAYAGILPAPLQDAVASAVACVGIELPHSGRDSANGVRARVEKNPVEKGGAAHGDSGKAGSVEQRATVGANTGTGTGSAGTAGTNGDHQGDAGSVGGLPPGGSHQKDESSTDPGGASSPVEGGASGPVDGGAPSSDGGN